MRTKHLKLTLGDKLPLFLKSFFQKETPLLAKGLIAITFFYVLSPVDALPAWLGPLGWVDDALLIPLMVNLVVGMLPQATVQRKLEEKVLYN